MSPDENSQRSEADKLVDDMDFGELCNEFECISSPSIEATARQLARDILELREGNRALGTFAVSVKYKVLNRIFASTQQYINRFGIMTSLMLPLIVISSLPKEIL